MKPLTMEELVLLPERRAAMRRADDANWAVLKWVLAAFAFPATLATVIFLTESNRRLTLLWGLTLMVILVIFLLRKRPGFTRRFRQILLGYLVFQLVIVVLAGPEPGVRFAMAGFLFPATLLLFRLRPSEVLGLLAVGFGIALWSVSQGSPDSETVKRVTGTVTASGWATLMYFVLTGITRRSHRLFIDRWRREVVRDRESTRMRVELDDAREIQLSMLPDTVPALDWVDLASISLPATEVGGDYFDFVPLPEAKIALVVGDVAGHGMSSGLMLAAVRGGLYLLREELANPIEPLERLNRMVRDVAPKRMYVTLQIGVLERDRITVVNAGHPPALHYDAARGVVREVGTAAMALGTGLDTPFSEDRRALAANDVLLFYSDGAIEVVDAGGDQFGDERLAEALLRAAAEATADGIRDAVVAAIDEFKGDVTPEDDLTLVVARIK